jgi:hypothetical protein
VSLLAGLAAAATTAAPFFASLVGPVVVVGVDGVATVAVWVNVVAGAGGVVTVVSSAGVVTVFVVVTVLGFGGGGGAGAVGTGAVAVGAAAVAVGVGVGVAGFSRTVWPGPLAVLVGVGAVGAVGVGAVGAVATGAVGGAGVEVVVVRAGSVAGVVEVRVGTVRCGGTVTPVPAPPPPHPLTNAAASATTTARVTQCADLMRAA